MISIKNFVDTNIEVITQPQVFAGFKTTIYFAPVTINNPTVVGGNFVVIKSYTEYEANVVSNNSAIDLSVETYFQNGGTALCIVNPSAYTLEGFKADMRAVSEVVDDYFYVVIANSLIGTVDGYPDREIYAIANFCSGNGWSDTDNKSLNTMRACFTTNLSDFVSANNFTSLLAVVKYSNVSSAGNLLDAALLVGAYFSQIDTSEVDSIKDYNFTPENLNGGQFEDIDQSTFDSLINTPTNGYYNVICKVANRVVNIGGNYCSQDGVSLALDFGASCIEHDLNYSNMELLLGKLALNADGQTKLINGIRAQLQKYVDDGFLETDATYQGETKTVSYGGKKYTVIKEGDVLPLGYKLFYVPINAISAADRAAKRFPYIYVALQSVHGARLIQVNGSIL